MRRAALSLALLAAGASLRAADVPAPRRVGAFDVRTLAPGVSVFTAAVAGMDPANSLVVERRDGLLVVDAQPSADAGRELLAAIAKETKKSVRYLVLTHPHAEACGGASAFPASVLVVASVRARDKLAEPAYDFGGEARARGAAGYAPPARPVPVLVADGPFILDDPDRRVVVYPLPRGHSEGNLMVEVPSVHVWALGSLLVADRNPYAGDAVIGQWLATLNELVRLPEATLVPAHGPPQTPEEARALRDAFSWARARIQKGFVDLVPREEIVPQALADPKAATWFDLTAKPSFARGVFDLVYAEALDDRKKRGLP